MVQAKDGRGWTRVTAKEVMEVADRHPVKAELLADGM